MFPESRYHQSGFGLPVAVFVITVLAVIIAAMAGIQQNSSQSLSLQANSYRAFYAAESGAQLALNLLIPPDGSAGRSCSQSPYYTQSFAVTGLNSCSVSVACRSISDGGENYYIVSSTGQCGSGIDQAMRQVEVMVK